MGTFAGMIALVLGLCGAHAFALQGTVRDAGSGSPIPHVFVAVAGEPLGAESDSAGRYTLCGFESGAHTVRFQRLGYEQRSVTITFGADQVVQLDAELTPHPLVLPSVAIVGRRDGADAGVPRNASFDRSGLATDPLATLPDPLAPLAALGGVTFQPDAPAGLHVEGGSADQNLMLLDGVPTYVPYHAGGMLSALGTDAIGGVTLSDGIPDARFGNALSSVVSMSTAPVGLSGFGLRGTASSQWVEQTLTNPLPNGEGGVLLTGRLSAPRPTPADEIHGASTMPGFADGLAKAEIAAGPGTLELLATASGDWLAFDAASDGPGVSGTAPSIPYGSRNRFGWSGGTQAALWRASAWHGLDASVRLWHSGLDASGRWQTGAGGVRVTSGIQNVGLGVDVSHATASSQPAFGFTLQRLGTGYGVEPSIFHDGTVTTSFTPYTLQSSPLLASTYLEDRWQLGQAWAVSAGLRGSGITSGSFALDPRLVVEYSPVRHWTVSAGYGRTHQYLQSLRNEESILSPLLAVDFPIAAGSATPVARADRLTAGVRGEIGPGTTVRVDARLTRFAKLLLVAPSTAQPFAVNGFSVGSGSAADLSAAFRHRGPRLSLEAAYTLSRTVRQAGGMQYTPGFNGTHTIVAGAGWRLARTTTVHGALWVIAGRRTSLLADALRWGSAGALGGIGDVDGSPQTLVGALDGQPLPTYARLDVGIRHDWHLRLGGRPVTLTSALDVLNLLNRANAIGLVSAPTGTATPIAILPRSLSFRLAWRY